jgi:hypothetical protein
VKKTVLLAVLGCLVAVPGLRAATIEDPLHGFCGTTASGSTCTDNGTITPSGSLADFGFWADPNPQTGDDIIVILISDQIAGADSMTFTLQEQNSLTSVSSTNDGLWTTGDLSAFLGLPGTTSPSNPLSAFSTCSLCPSVTDGFYVYTFDFGTQTLDGNSSGNVNPYFEFTAGSLPTGGIITDFLVGSNPNPGQNNTATAPSGALLLTGGSGSGGGSGGAGGGSGAAAVPEPASLLLLGTGLGFAATRLRRKNKK